RRWDRLVPSGPRLVPRVTPLRAHRPPAQPARRRPRLGVQGHSRRPTTVLRSIRTDMTRAVTTPGTTNPLTGEPTRRPAASITTRGRVAVTDGRCTTAATAPIRTP